MKKFIIPILLFCVGYANQMKAEDTDLSTYENVIYVAPQTVTVGETATLSICMKNTADIRGFQFDMYLPDGVTVQKNNKGKIVGVAFNEDRLPEDDEHTITLQTQEDGAIRFLVGSLYDETFTGNDGELMTMEVNVAASMTAGTYPIILKTMKLSETDISKSYEAAAVETTLTVTTTTGIQQIDNAAGASTTHDLQGRRVQNPAKGLYIIDGKKQVVR